MKKFVLKLLFILSLFSITTISICQNIKKIQNEILTKKKEFFNEKIPLNLEEQKKFWPVYEDYFKRLNFINQQRNSLMNYFSSNEKNLSDEEIKDILEKIVKLEDEEYKVNKEYYEKFKAILPERKLVKIFILENDFKKWLLTQTLNIRENRRK